MKEFIINNPIFSYIAVPVLFVVLVVLIIVLLRPKQATIGNHFAKLYHTTLLAIDFIGGEKTEFGRDKLKILLKMLAKMKFYYEMLESEELYEVENIIKNIEKASATTRAMLVAKSSVSEVFDYLANVDGELKEVRKVLFGFSLMRDAEKTSGFSAISQLGFKKSRKKAEEYLKNLKK